MTEINFDKKDASLHNQMQLEGNTLKYTGMYTYLIAQT